MLRDLRHGFRVLLQAKGWTVNGLLLRSLPVHDPSSLVRLRWSGSNYENVAWTVSPFGPGADIP